MAEVANGLVRVDDWVRELPATHPFPTLHVLLVQPTRRLWGGNTSRGVNR